MRYCPICKSDLTFIEYSKQWYCNKCGKVPIIITDSEEQVKSTSTRKSVLIFISGINAVIGLTIILMFIVSITYINEGIFTHDNNLYFDSEDYYSEFSESGPKKEYIGFFQKGFMALAITIFIIVLHKFYLQSTLQSPAWWKKLYYEIDKNYNEPLEHLKMKKTICSLYTTYYGVLGFLGVLTVFIGLIFMLMSDKGVSVLFFNIEIILGVLLLYSSYCMYTSEILRSTKYIHPLLRIFPYTYNPTQNYQANSR